MRMRKPGDDSAWAGGELLDEFVAEVFLGAGAGDEQAGGEGDDECGDLA